VYSKDAPTYVTMWVCEQCPSPYTTQCIFF
jgi:hypothetical protein